RGGTGSGARAFRPALSRSDLLEGGRRRGGRAELRGGCGQGSHARAHRHESRPARAAGRARRALLAGRAVGRLERRRRPRRLPDALTRDRTDDATLKYLEQGPRAFARFAATSRLRLVFDAGLLRRHYDNLDPTLAATRADTYLDGAAAAELDLADRWTGRFWLAARRAFSNVPDFAYTELSAGLTLTLVTGLL